MIPCQRHLFDIPDDVIYLNCAYMSPLMKSVVAAGVRGAGRKAAPWQISAADFFTETETARDLFARLTGASADDIAVVPSASYGLAVAAANMVVRAGQEILVLEDQFPSNYYSWQALAQENGAGLRVLPRPEDGDWTSALLDAIGPEIAFAALPNCHWTDGAIIDLALVGSALRDVGAGLVLDLTQSLGALPTDLSAIRPNFAVCATYKWLMGPYSLGFLYVAPEHQTGNPIEHNWIARAGAQNFAELVNYKSEFQVGARRFDVGERSNFALMPQAIEAMRQLLIWGVPEIAATLSNMTAHTGRMADARDIGNLPAKLRAGHFIGLRFSKPLPDDFAEQFAAQNIFVSRRGDSLRVTPHLYNTETDIDRLFAAIDALV